MKNAIALYLFLLSSLVSYSQSIQMIMPTEGRRNQNVFLEIFADGTNFGQSSSFTIILKSNSDGSEITATDIWVGDDTYLSGTIFIPATATPDIYSVSVQTTNQGKLTLPDAFTVSSLPPLPMIISFTPTNAIHGQQVNMTIVARYTQYTSASMVQVRLVGGNTYLTSDSVVVVNDSTITTVLNIPKYSQSDTCQVFVTADLDYAFGDQNFIINGINPQIVSLSPDSASAGNHVDITIHTSQTQFTTDSNFTATLQGIGFNGTTSTITVVNDSELIAGFDIPLHAQSSLCDLVIGTSGGTIRSNSVFTIDGVNPVLLGISPNEIAQGAMFADVIILGKDMFFTEASNIYLSMPDPNGYQINWSPLIVVNDSQLLTYVDIPLLAPLGLYDINLTVDGRDFYLQGALKVIDDGIPDPALVSITPNTTPRGQIVDVTIRGIQTHFTFASNLSVTLSGPDNVQGTSIIVINDTILMCRFGFPTTATRGVYNLYVDGAEPNLVLMQGFTVTSAASDPALVSISPGIVFAGQPIDITVTGVNTHFMDTSSNLSMAIINQLTSIAVEPISFEVTGNTTIKAHFEIPDTIPLGIYDFGVVSDVDGYLELLQSVTVNAVGLDEKEQVITNLYPNPVHNNLFIDTKYPIRACSIVDITGKQTVVDPNEFKQTNTYLILPIDKLGLRSGIYFIRLDSDDGFDYKKFVVD